jgi:hypothetical protein
VRHCEQRKITTLEIRQTPTLLGCERSRPGKMGLPRPWTWRAAGTVSAPFVNLEAAMENAVRCGFDLLLDSHSRRPHNALSNRQDAD